MAATVAVTCLVDDFFKAAAENIPSPAVACKPQQHVLLGRFLTLSTHPPTHPPTFKHASPPPPLSQLPPSVSLSAPAGKEANVYHACTPDGSDLAIKVYKTSILVFKDRDR